MLMASDQQAQLVSAAQAHRGTDYFCPGCTAPVVLRRGTTLTAHFAHRPGAACTTFSEGETAEHLQGKQQLATWFANSGYQVQLEAPLPALQQRPDILVHLSRHMPLAIEFQCSPLSDQRLWERTAGYWQNGYRVVWLLGRPYHQRVKVHGKALKFLQYSPDWGCFILLWDVRQAKLTLNYQLRGLDCEPLNRQTISFDTQKVTVNQVLMTHPVLTPAIQVAPKFQGAQQQRLLNRLRLRGNQRDLQDFCYQHGGTLQQLPAWVGWSVAQPPLLTVPYFVWSLHVFIGLRTQAADITNQQLEALAWQTLRPLLARNACVRQRGTLYRHLITELIAQLRAQRVIRPNVIGWHLNGTQLQWKKH